MTPRDLVLDPNPLFEQRPLTLFRITKFKYASLSGEGAAKSPGRWNARGEEAIYTGTELGTTVLERLVHTPKDRIADDLALMKLTLTGNWSIGEMFTVGRDDTDRHSALRFDRTTKGRFLAIPSLEIAEEMNLGMSTGFAVAIPSVIVPVWNVVLFPQQPGFWEHVSIQSVEPFEFDPRLFRESALREIDLITDAKPL